LATITTERIIFKYGAAFRTNIETLEICNLKIREMLRGGQTVWIAESKAGSRESRESIWSLQNQGASAEHLKWAQQKA
jgi:hypothetical protein